MDACGPHRAAQRCRASIDHEGVRWERLLSLVGAVLAALVEGFLSPFNQCHRPVVARTPWDSAHRLPEHQSRAETRSDKRIAGGGGGNREVKSHAGVLPQTSSFLSPPGRTEKEHIMGRTPAFASLAHPALYDTLGRGASPASPTGA
jgi:hypothetical protein